MSSYVYTKLAEDTFQRPDENPLTPLKWTLTTGGVSAPIKLVNHQVVGTSGSLTSSMYYSAASIPPNQYVEVTTGTIDATGTLEFEARASLDSQIGYVVQYQSNFLIFAGGAPIQVFGVISTTIKTGDKVRIECFGTRVSCLINGEIVASGKDASLASGITDISCAPGAVTGFSGFEAGSISVMGDVISCAPRPEPNTWEVIYTYPLDVGGIGESILVVGPQQPVQQWSTLTSTIAVPSNPPGAGGQVLLSIPDIVKWGTFGVGNFGGTRNFPYSYFFGR